jgi:hypothetical protein
LIVRVLISIGLSALILWGMIVGQRLAWQWGRILGIVAAVLVSIGALLAFVTAARDRASALAAMVVGSILLLQAICLYTIFFALGRPSAMEHFKLRCPSCGKFTYKAANFFFTRAKCKYCNITW